MKGKSHRNFERAPHKKPSEKKRTCSVCQTVTTYNLTYTNATGRLICNTCHVALGYYARLINLNLEWIDPAHSAIPSATLDKCISLACTIIRLYGADQIKPRVLSLLPRGDPPIWAPEILHILERFAHNANCSIRALCELTTIIPYTVMDLDIWGLHLLNNPLLEDDQHDAWSPTAYPLRDHSDYLARLAVAHQIYHGTESKNHWLARWYTYLQKNDCNEMRHEYLLPGTYPSEQGEMYTSRDWVADLNEQAKRIWSKRSRHTPQIVEIQLYSGEIRYYWNRTLYWTLQQPQVNYG